MDSIVQIKKVSRAYRKNKVLKDLSLDIKKGEIFGIIGASGSGKTTLLNTIIGFLPPTYGEVLYLSADGEMKSVISAADQVKRNFGFAAQEPSFYGKLSLSENLDLFGSLHNLSRDAKKTNAIILLKLMGLYDYRKTLAEDMSGGMQKRLDIACALIHDPKVLILDEPTADLDPHLRYQMWNLIKKINTKGTTIVLSSHFLDELEDICDRIGILHSGKLDTVGTPEELKRHVSVNEEVRVETLKADYDKIIAAFKPLKRFKITKVEDRVTELSLYTSNTHVVIEKLLKTLDKQRDVLVNLHVSRPTLNDVFEQILINKK